MSALTPRTVRFGERRDREAGDKTRGAAGNQRNRRHVSHGRRTHAGFPVAPADWARYAALWAYYLAFLNIAAPEGFYFSVGAMTAERARWSDINFLGIDKKDFSRLAADWVGLSAAEASFVFDEASFFELRPHDGPGL
jgi:hypothetical protein